MDELKEYQKKLDADIQAAKQDIASAKNELEKVEAIKANMYRAEGALAALLEKREELAAIREVHAPTE